MRILFLTQVLPYPLTSGARIRAYYMLRKLCEQHAVTLVSFVRPDDEEEAVAHLRGLCAAVYTVPMRRRWWRTAAAVVEGIVPGRSMVIARDRIAAMRRRLARLVREQRFDLVHADQTAMAQYALWARRWSHVAPQVVLDQHNALYRVVGRQAAETGNRLARSVWQFEARQLRRYEAGLMRAFDHVLTVAGEDSVALLALGGATERQRWASKMTMIPICVDPDGSEPVVPVDDGPQIVFLGTMFWPPNASGVVWFAEQIMPRILAAVPNARLTIVGKQPPPAVRALSTDGSPLAGHVEVTGFVADPTPLLARCRAFVVPLLAGGGMRVKIVDAWQWGVPIVTTVIGAEGIAVRHGVDVLMADDPGEFANHVVMLLNDAGLRERLRQNGFHQVRNTYNWRVRYADVDALYRRLVAEPATA